MKNNYFYLILGLIFLSFQVFATDYYVSPNGNDTNDGKSSTNAWKTLNQVNGFTFQPGDRLLLEADGTWNGQLWPKGSGSANLPIIIDQYGTGNKPRINGNGTDYPSTLVKGAVMLYNQSYWEINNLEVSNYHETFVNARAGILILSVSATIQNHIYIRNCYVHDVNSNPSSSSNKNTGGIIFFGSSIDQDGNYVNVNSGFNDVLVENCRVYNVTKEGIRNKSDNKGAYPRVNSNVVFRNNHIENVFGDGIVLAEIFKGGLVERNYVKNVAYTNSANYAGIWTHYSTGSIIQYNEVCDITGGFNDGEAFDADNNCNGDIFQYNFSHNNKGGFFLIMPSAQNIIIRYNISQNDGDGTELFHYTGNSFTSNLIYNNTFYIGAGIRTTIFRDGNSTRTITFFNNIIEVDGTITKFADNPLSSKSFFANNCFYPASIAAINGPSQHPGLITSNPQLIDPSGTNYSLNNVDGFKLSSTSPIINAGLAINGNGGRDYLGTNLYIDNKADIGALEYPVAGNSSTTSLGLQTIADTYVRNGTYESQNFGTESTLGVKKDDTTYERETYLKFDLNSLTEKPKLINLKLYIAAGDTEVETNTWKVFLMSNDSWQENTLTWKNKPSTTLTELATATGNKAGNFVEFDISNAVIDEYEGDKILSLQVVSMTPGSKTSVDFASKEYFIADYAPQLIIDKILPVNFISFNAKRQNSSIKLKWEVALESKVSHYQVLRSKDGINFQPIGKLNSTGSESTYYFNDFSPESGINYYQISAVDFDGKTQISELLAVAMNRQEKLSLKLIDAQLTLEVMSPKAESALFTLTDIQGKTLSQKTIYLQQGLNTIQIPDWSKGLLIMEIKTATDKGFLKIWKN